MFAIINLFLCRHLDNNSVRLLKKSNSFKSSYCYYFSKTQVTYSWTAFIRHCFCLSTPLQTKLSVTILSGTNMFFQLSALFIYTLLLVLFTLLMLYMLHSLYTCICYLRCFMWKELSLLPISVKRLFLFIGKSE